MKLLQCQNTNIRTKMHIGLMRCVQGCSRSDSKSRQCFNRFRTGQGLRRANMHKWGLAQSPSCDYGQRQTMNHIVDMCPLTKFEGRLNLLYEVSGDSHMPKIYSDCSTCEIIIIITAV